MNPEELINRDELKQLALAVITRHGTRDVDYMTYSEIIYDALEERGIECFDEEIQALIDSLNQLVNSAKHFVNWDDDRDEYYGI